MSSPGFSSAQLSSAQLLLAVTTRLLLLPARTHAARSTRYESQANRVAHTHTSPTVATAPVAPCVYASLWTSRCSLIFPSAVGIAHTDGRTDNLHRHHQFFCSTYSPLSLSPSPSPSTSLMMLMYLYKSRRLALNRIGLDWNLLLLLLLLLSPRR